jgi:hypothetical protein
MFKSGQVSIETVPAERRDALIAAGMDKEEAKSVMKISMATTMFIDMPGYPVPERDDGADHRGASTRHSTGARSQTRRSRT